jgi:membrane protease YdiL (CAAX protease family)
VPVTGDSSALFGKLAEEPALEIISSVGLLLATLGAVWAAGRFWDRRPFRSFGFHLAPGWWLDFAFGLFLGALLMTAIFAAERVAGWLTVTGTFKTAEPEGAFVFALLVPAVTFLCVGIYEELLFRGYILRNLAEGLNLPRFGPLPALLMAWLFSSVVFGLAHGGNPHASVISTTNLVAAGLFLAVGYLLTGELALPIGLHITWNFFQGNVFGFPVSGAGNAYATFVSIRQGGPDMWTGGAFGPEAGLIGLLAMLMGSLLILLWVRARRGRLAWRTDLAQYARPLTVVHPEPLTTVDEMA